MASIKHAAWVHGVNIQLENSSWSALRQASGTSVRPSATATSGWVHFAIPTPVIVDGARLQAWSSLIRFATGSQATIGAYRLYDGETQFLGQDTNYHGDLQTVRVDVPSHPSILWGTLISLRMDFNGAGPDAWIQLVSAGIDFFAPTTTPGQ